MNNFIFSKYIKNISLLFFLLLTLNNNNYAQSYHDCTAVEDFNELSDKTENSEEMIDTMELEFAKSLSRFDKCLDQDYFKSNDNSENNDTQNSTNEGKNEGEELAEKKEQEGKSDGEELAEKKEQEGKNEGEELAEKNFDNKGSFSKNETNSSLENESSNNMPILKSIASSELSGTEISKETIEESSEFSDNNTNQNNLGYEVVKEIKSEESKDQVKLPEDIPQDDNDSVLEKQIKLAAMNEKDPEKKKRLWNEYRKYKGIPKKE